MFRSATQHGFVSTMMGRRRYLLNIKSQDQSSRSKAERQAVNSIIQGSASDLIKYAMLLLEKTFRSRSGNAIPRIVMQIHDELVYEIPIEHVDLCRDSDSTDWIFSNATAMQLTREIRELMTSVVAQDLRLAVPLIANISLGVNWGKMKPCQEVLAPNESCDTAGKRSID